MDWSSDSDSAFEYDASDYSYGSDGRAYDADGNVLDDSRKITSEVKHDTPVRSLNGAYVWPCVCHLALLDAALAIWRSTH